MGPYGALWGPLGPMGAMGPHRVPQAAGLRAAAESFTVVSEPVAVAVAVGKKVAKKGRK